MTALNDIRRQLDHTAGVIEDFRRLVSGGTPVDLSGLDENIAAMCNAIGDLPPDERPGLRSALVTLMADMDTLVDTLRRQHEATTQELKGVSSRQKAVSAYGKGGSAGESKNDPHGAGPKK